ncbi:hypothetical protein [Streptomyces sp. Da 82-17]|uniref:hypothetical protein n=1 Tax=Streptomyces sp. Da 82-17 TaxID=3377116 RepID=UPI0038D39BC6
MDDANSPRPQSDYVLFEEVTVRSLPKPRPFREDACMPAGIGWARRWIRQIRPRRGSRTCCWYHRGDWHEVNAMARKVLQRARAADVEPKDMETFAREHAAASGADAWQTKALATLFNVDDAIVADGEGYVNGQHRAQAMLDAGVRTTIVLQVVQPSRPGQ